jgi:hypothetical protein
MRKADRTNSTFGFCRHSKANAKKPKELFFANALKGIKNLMKQDKRKYSKLQSLKTGLIQYLLSGMVRVNHLVKETASI